VPSAVEVSDRFRSGPTAEVATDDWPFFYMQRRTYPVTYAVMVGILVTLSGWFVIRHLGVRRPSASPDGVFFFLGAGFMLIETKAMTELGLVFGNTWSVVAVALSAVLFMGFMANHWVQRRGPVANGPCFAGLGAALGASWVVTRAAVAGLPIPAESIVLPVVLTLPVFCGGLVFSSELARQGTVGAALSANLLGAMLGGFLEYNSMYWGFSALYPIGALLYGFAFLCARQEPRTVPDAPMPAGAKKLRQAQPERLEM
jgi:hypothetical protein